MKLIREFVDFQDLEIIQEVKEDKKKVYKIKGPYIQADLTNKNKRRYKLPIVEREVKKINDEKISKNRCFGECDHPDTPVVSLQKVSHLISELKMNGNIAMGCSDVLDTPCGRVLQTILDAGGKLMVSTRGVGSLNEADRDGCKEVKDNWKLITVDAVSDGSAPGCVVEGILENKEFIIENDQIVEVAVENLEKKLSCNSKEIVQYLREFLEELRKNL